MAAGSGVSHAARAYGASWRRPAWTSSGTDGAWAARRSSFARRSGSGSRRRSGGSSAQPPPRRIQQACPADAPVGTRASSRADFRVMEWTDESHQRAATAVALLLRQQSGHQPANQPAACCYRRQAASRAGLHVAAPCVVQGLSGYGTGDVARRATSAIEGRVATGSDERWVALCEVASRVSMTSMRVF